MTKTELIDKLAATMGSSKTQAALALESFSKVITQALTDGADKIPLPDLGTFHAKKTPARQGRNPTTGQPITIPAGTRVTFKASKALKDSLGGGDDEGDEG